MSKDISEWSLVRQDSKVEGSSGWETVGSPDTASSSSGEEEVEGLSRQVTKRTAVQFSGLLATVRLEEVEALALSIRARVDGGDSPKLTCELQTPPFNGFYNLVYKITWSNGKEWAFKIPRRGHVDEWSDTAARGSHSEFFAMRLLAEKTTIPLPRVYELDTGFDNELECPFMFMDWLPGVPLLDLWDRFVSTPNVFDDTLVRVNLLKELASVMVQLEFGRYRVGGTPLFSPEGNFLEIGPLITRELGIESFENLPELIEVGPIVDHFDFMTWKIERAHTRAEEDPEYNFYKRRDDQLRTVYGMMVTWMDDTMLDQKDFILAHTDFGPQNVLVDPETGRLTGIIDFDGVTAVPRYLSNGYRGSYPHWLTRDQDLYEGPDNDTTNFPVNREECDYWRAIWRFFINEANINKSTNPLITLPRSRLSWTEIPRTYADGLTPAYSLDARIMSIAANDPINSLPKIVDMVIKRIIYLSEHYPYLFRAGNDYEMSQSETALSSTSNTFIQDPMTMGQILVPTTATTIAAANLMDEITLDMNSLGVSSEPVSPSDLTSSIESIFDNQPLPEGFRRFKSTNLLHDAAEKRLCQADLYTLRGWFVFLFAGQDHSGRVVEGYCDDTDEGEMLRANRRDEPYPASDV